eukprot:2508079-Rhodomonas_salina.1
MGGEGAAKVRGAVCRDRRSVQRRVAHASFPMPLPMLRGESARLDAEAQLERHTGSEQLRDER